MAGHCLDSLLYLNACPAGWIAGLITDPGGLILYSRNATPSLIRGEGWPKPFDAHAQEAPEPWMERSGLLVFTLKCNGIIHGSLILLSRERARLQLFTFQSWEIFAFDLSNYSVTPASPQFSLRTQHHALSFKVAPS